MDRRVVTKYLVTILLAGAISFYYCLSKEFLLQTSALEKYRILADAFTIPGLLLTCFGLLLWFSTLGALDGVGYGIKMAIRMLIPGAWLHGQEEFHEYVEARKKNRIKGFGFILHVGLLFLAISGIFMYLFYKIYNG